MKQTKSRFGATIPKKQRQQRQKTTTGSSAYSRNGATKRGSFRGLPEIWLPENNQYISEFALSLGKILKNQDVFWRLDKCVTPKQDEKGIFKLEEVTAQEFRSLIENYCAPVKWRRSDTKKPEKVRRSLGAEDATATLLTRDYLKQLRPVRAFNQVRLPAFYGKANLQLLPLGYDPIHQVYTAPNAFDYPQTLSLQDAKKFLDELLSEFCFVATNAELSKSIILAAGLTLYAAHLLPRYTIRPNFLVNANSEGSGKTLLCKIPIIAVLGEAPVATVPKNEDEMRKFIAGAALSGSPVLFLDNVKGYLSSASLEALSTSPVTEFRVLGLNKLGKAEHGLTVFMTANRATFSPDLARRTFAVELFLEEVRAESRPINHPLDDAGIIKLRPKILASFWALVDAWAKAGFPLPKQANQAFVAWNRVVGAILENAGYISPSRTGKGMSQAGDAELSDMEKFVAEMVEYRAYKIDELIDHARHHQVFEWIVGNDGDPALEPRERRIFGLLLKRFTSRVFRIPTQNYQLGKPMRFELLSRTARKLYGLRDP